MRLVKQKVFAYITHNHHLLVFNHPFSPEAGIQVPAGTIEEGEHPEAAVLREAFEETGLTDLTLDCFLGEQKRDMSDFGRDEIHYRRFYHLMYRKTPPHTWRHEELYHSSDSSQMSIIFKFFWAPLPDEIPHLVADHGIVIPQLLKVLSTNDASKVNKRA